MNSLVDQMPASRPVEVAGHAPALHCPTCGLALPLPRLVRAAQLRCPALACGAPVRIRGGMVRAA